jgi:hypothetical protein
MVSASWAHRVIGLSGDDANPQSAKHCYLSYRLGSMIVTLPSKFSGKPFENQSNPK